MNKFFEMLKSAVTDFLDDECMVSAAALAYYTIFSLPPLLVLVFFVAGLFHVSDQKIHEVVSRQIGLPVSSVGEANPKDNQPEEEEKAAESSTSGNREELSSLAKRQAADAQPMKALGPVSKIIGAIILIFSATGVFAQLQNALNRAWEVEPDPEQGGWKNFLAKRGLSLGMIVAIAFLLLVSLVLTTLVDEAARLVVGEEAGVLGTAIGIVLNALISLVLASLLFAAMYKTLPDAKITWKDTFVGAFITAMLFVIGKELLGWYLQNSQIGSAWGSAATSMVALLVWVYYASIIVLLGAELTQAWAKYYGRGIEPEKDAVRVIEQKEHVRNS